MPDEPEVHAQGVDLDALVERVTDEAVHYFLDREELKAAVRRAMTEIVAQRIAEETVKAATPGKPFKVV